MTRAEHLQQCKVTTIQIVNSGDIIRGWTSFLSDMLKHDETKSHSALDLGMILYMGGHLSTIQSMKKYINGFN